MIPFELLGYAMVMATRFIINFLIVVENKGYGDDDTDIGLC
jgi:hypothetical protein